MEKKENIAAGYPDALRKIGVTGAGRAAMALSEITSAAVEIDVPEARLIAATQFSTIVSAGEEHGLALVIVLEGELGGRVFFLLAPREARLLGARLLGMEPGKVDFEDPLFQNSIKEVLSIIAGAYMAALSELTGYEVMFSIPYLALDVITAAFIAEQTPQRSADMIFIKTQLKIEGTEFGCEFMFFPDMPSTGKIFKALRLAQPAQAAKPV
ncbi:MAG: chemotaxis protein CheC [Elusimicrobiales bacterium]|nr:chemotaxis protein CheC [Elusimicrobiales bacterium]